MKMKGVKRNIFFSSVILLDAKILCMNNCKEATREDGNPILRSSVGNFIFFSDFNCLHVATVSLILLRMQPRETTNCNTQLVFQTEKNTRSERTSKVVEQGNESILKMCIHAKFNTFCSGTICQGTQQISISPLRT